MPATFENISTTTLTSAQATITFSSIPQTYTDLRIVLVSIYDAPGNDSRFRFNGDTGTSYATTCINSEGTAVDSLRSNTDGIYWSLWQSYTAATYMLLTADIFSYTGNTFKSSLNTSSSAFSNGNVSTTVGTWRNTSAITSITLFQGGGNFIAGTTATLFGIKAA